MSYEEIDPYAGRHTSDGDFIHADPRIVFEETKCARCGEVVGPHLGIDSETGYDRPEWRTCFTGPFGILCEDCVGDVEFEDKWAVFREMWWMDDAVNEHGAFEAEYETMYNLWYMTEAEFWGPMVGASEALRFGYSDDKRAWTAVKRVNSLDRHIPQWVRSMRFRGVEAA